jgi:hypothetical protein
VLVIPGGGAVVALGRVGDPLLRRYPVWPPLKTGMS